MIATINIPTTINIKYLQIEVSDTYWEDSYVNGAADSPTDPKIPCWDNGVWKAIINVDSGKIVNWEQGITAEIQYKVRESGVYHILDDKLSLISSLHDEYVPDCIGEYGDYIKMSVEEDGTIKNFSFTQDDINYFCKNYEKN